MRKLIIVLLMVMLFVTGCGNIGNSDKGTSIPSKKISADIYTYSIQDWKGFDDNPDVYKQNIIVDKIIAAWEKNNEGYAVNFDVNVDSVRDNINEQIIYDSNSEKSIFQIACEIVGIDYNTYTSE